MVNTVFAAFLGLWAAVLGTCHVLVIETFHLARHHRGDQLQIAQRCKGVGKNKTSKILLPFVNYSVILNRYYVTEKFL